MASTWNASDLTGGMSLSNGGLTLTLSSVGAAFQIVRNTISQTSGKLYIEFKTSTGVDKNTGAAFQLGVASSGVNINDYLGNSNYSFGENPLYGSAFGSAGFSGLTTSNLTGFINPGDVLAVAVDFTASKIWLALNNVWSDGGNPATGANPVQSFVPATVGALFAAMSFYGVNSPVVWTLQATAASQKYAPPSGFNAWDPVVVNFVDLAGNLAPSVALSAGLTFSVDMAGDLAPSLTFAADVAVLKAPVDLTGDLAPSLTFLADLSTTSVSYVDLAGGLAPSLTFAADLTIVFGPHNYVDFTGNLGSPSSYGRLSYGQKHYSRIDAFAPLFSADLDIVGQVFFNGDLRPVVSFSGALASDKALAGDLSLIVDFSGTVGLQADFSGDLSPQITLQGDLTLDLPLQGNLPFEVDLACPGLISEPLWGETEPCLSPPWAPSEPSPPPVWAPSQPCPPSMWTPIPPPTFTPPSGRAKKETVR